MNKNAPLFTASFLFLLVALLHLVRYYLNLEVVVAGHSIPMQVSLYGFVVTFLLSLWMGAAALAKKQSR